MYEVKVVKLPDKDRQRETHSIQRVVEGLEQAVAVGCLLGVEVVVMVS